MWRSAPALLPWGGDDTSDGAIVPETAGWFKAGSRRGTFPVARLPIGVAGAVVAPEAAGT